MASSEGIQKYNRILQGILLPVLLIINALGFAQSPKATDLTEGEIKYLNLMQLLIEPVLVAPGTSQFNNRIVGKIDFDWRFINQDVQGAEKPGYDDREWDPVNLPHDWAMAGPFQEDVENGKANGYRPRDIGWYRKAFTTPESIEGRKVYLDFDAVRNKADVYLNGEHLGRHLNLYLNFSFDITNYLNPAGEENILAVRVDNTDPNNSRWYTGSGINGHVWLRLLNGLHIPQSGTYISTPYIHNDSAVVKVETEVANHYNQEMECELLTSVHDPQGVRIAGEATKIIVEPGQVMIIEQYMTVQDPKLWSPITPRLYSVVSQVVTDVGRQDEYASQFGFRTIAFEPGVGFLLNGKKTMLKGGNIHHTTSPLGGAIFERSVERQVEILKKAGCNAVRLAHNPYPQIFLDVCDRMGLLVFNEAYDKWASQYIGHEPGFEFEDTYRQDLGQLVKRDRNHPSVFIWSVGNEVELEVPDIEVNGETYKDGEWQKEMFLKLKDRVKELDDTRPVTFASTFLSERMSFKNPETGEYEPPATRDEPHQVQFLTDVGCVNYQTKRLESWLVKYPEYTCIIGETSSNGGSDPWFNFDHLKHPGMFYWGIINYLGETQEGWPRKSWIHGQINRTGWYNSKAYAVEASYSSEPMVAITVQKPGTEELQETESHWNWEGEESVFVYIFTNAESVELVQNGVSLDERVANEHGKIENWRVKYAKGTLKAIAKTNGKKVAEYSLVTAGEPDKIMLKPSRTRLKDDGYDLSYIDVVVTDKYGIRIPSAAYNIRFNITGAGASLGIDNGDDFSSEEWVSDNRTTYKGKALLVLRGSNNRGPIRVTAISPGLKSALINLKVTK